MANSTAIPSVDERLAQGFGAWDLGGITLLNGIKDFCDDHTHTGTPDGTALPAGSYAAGSIDLDDVAAEVKLQTHEYVYGAEANEVDYPVFRAPAAGVVNAVYLTPAAAIVSATDNGHILRIEKYSAAGATLGGTLCAIANTVAASTLAALVPQTFGAITGGTLTAGELLVFTKSSIGTGLAIGVGALLTIHWTPS